MVDCTEKVKIISCRIIYTMFIRVNHGVPQVHYYTLFQTQVWREDITETLKEEVKTIKGRISFYTETLIPLKERTFQKISCWSSNVGWRRGGVRLQDRQQHQRGGTQGLHHHPPLPGRQGLAVWRGESSVLLLFAEYRNKFLAKTYIPINHYKMHVDLQKWLTLKTEIYNADHLVPAAWRHLPLHCPHHRGHQVQ